MKYVPVWNSSSSFHFFLTEPLFFSSDFCFFTSFFPLVFSYTSSLFLSQRKEKNMNYNVHF